MSFKNRLKTKMEEFGYKPADIADAIGVKVQAVYKWQRGGTISMESAIKLAEFLKVEPAWLIFGGNPADLQIEPPDLEKLRERIEQLPEQHQQVVFIIVDALSKLN